MKNNLFKLFTLLILFSPIHAIAGMSEYNESPAGEALAEIQTLDNSTEPEDEIDAQAIHYEISPLKKDAQAISMKDEEPVPSDLTVLGKGISTGEGFEQHVLLMACVGKGTVEGSAESNCNVIRAIESVGNAPFKWIGGAFQVNGKEEFRAKLKKEYRKKYKIHFFRLKKDPKRSEKIVYGGFWVLVGGLVGGSALHVHIAATTAIAGVFGSIGFFTVILFLQSATNFDLVGETINLLLAPFRGIGNALTTDETHRLSDTEGWNWHDSAKKMGMKKFNKMRELVLDFSKEQTTTESPLTPKAKYVSFNNTLEESKYSCDYSKKGPENICEQCVNGIFNNHPDVSCELSY